ncbi:ABC transporter substrate-binding protein [Caloranaerobacter azorensis H53214]|uniref:Maltodextrin-binding protein n=1 Tax=Caloranaerobacter azorensis H53214 TaxID=1156417 RepID=A0A096DM65_9FIRM|nr:maltose ABC transporter substrate-binding protein [Caloranaerobacter azorensis]KGG80381.1 ABC transporter substrate-binding protein [Caloranaerobacter azorensis H53214]
MKKFLSFLLIAVLVFSLVGCGAKEEPAQNNQESKQENTNQQSASNELTPEPGAKLIVWESEGPESDWIKYVAEKFKEKYGVEVTYEAVANTDARNKLATDGPAGVGADVFVAPHDHTGELVTSGLVQVNDVTADRVKNDFMKAAADGVTFEGQVYGYPLAIETYALFYNKDLISKAPETFEEVIEFAKKYNNPEENKYALMWDVANAYFSHSFIAGNGGYVFGNGGTNKDDIGLNSDAAVEGAKFMVSLKEILPLNSADTNYQIMDGLFSEGKAAMIINGPWAVKGYQEAGVNFGIAPLPKLPGGKYPASFSGIRSMFVSSYTKYPNAAKLFAKFATSDEMLLKRFEITKQIPPVKSLMNEDVIKNNEVVAPFLAQAQYAVPMPSIPQMGVVWEPYGAAFASMWNDGVDPKEALDNAVQTIKEAIASQE